MTRRIMGKANVLEVGRIILKVGEEIFKVNNLTKSSC
jgi:hypothetical protein